MIGENPNHFSNICTHFNLGSPIQELTRIYGGLLHIMWRLDTAKGSYAIKQLSKDIDLKNEQVTKNYELTERIASRFAALGIAAISAITQAGRHLFIIDEIGFLAYPWVDAKALDQNAVSENHALKIAEILAKIHCLDLDEPEITETEFPIHANEKIIRLIEKCPVEELLKNQKNLLAANEAYQNAIPTLKTHIVVSHGDLDQKNVLWDKNDNPILIDWESARKLNPVYEIVNAALDWSGISSKFDKNQFRKMISAYIKAGGIIDERGVEAAFYGVLGNWINWMVYNLERSTSIDLEQRNIGIEQVTQTLAIIMSLQKLIPELIKLLITKD